MNKKKTTIISALLIMLLAVGGVLAYLTDTAGVTNTFTVGNVDITLDEADVDEDGNPLKDGIIVDNADDADRTIEGNVYHLIPGATYLKDPTVTVKKGSEDSYVRMILTVTNKNVMDEIIDKNDLNDYSDFFGGWNNTAWIYKGFTTKDDTISFEFRYKETVSGFDAKGKKVAVKLPALFKELVVPGSVTTEQLAKLNGDFDFDGTTDADASKVEVIITAHAIQVAGFDETVDADGNKISAEDNAWAAFDEQVKVNTEQKPENDDEESSDENSEENTDTI